MNTRSYATKDDAMYREVIEPIEASGVVESAADEFDVEAIFDETVTFDSGRQQFVPTAEDPEEFWASVARHAK